MVFPIFYNQIILINRSLPFNQESFDLKKPELEKTFLASPNLTENRCLSLDQIQTIFLQFAEALEIETQTFEKELLSKIESFSEKYDIKY